MTTLIDIKMSLSGFVMFCSTCEKVSLNESNYYCDEGHKMREYLMREGIITV